MLHIQLAYVEENGKEIQSVFLRNSQEEKEKRKCLLIYFHLFY